MRCACVATVEMSTYCKHNEATAIIAAPAETVFAFMDDPSHLGAHMGRHSFVMGGISMRTQTDARGGRAVGSVIRMSGRMWGLEFSLEEAVVERRKGQRKVWETLGDPRLLVIGRYRMGFEVQPTDRGTQLRVWIDFDLPARGLQHGLGRILGSFYANWCVRQMVREAERTLKRRIQK